MNAVPSHPLDPNRFPLAHLAVALENIDAAAPLYQALGFDVGSAESVARENVRARLASKGEFRIELLEPDPAGAGPIARFLTKRGPGLHHVALHSEDLDRDLAALKDAGIAPLKGYPAEGLHGTRVAFLDPKTTGGVLLELVEKKREPLAPAGRGST